MYPIFLLQTHSFDVCVLIAIGRLGRQRTALLCYAFSGVTWRSLSVLVAGDTDLLQLITINCWPIFEVTHEQSVSAPFKIVT